MAKKVENTNDETLEVKKLQYLENRIINNK